ncbi:hypothetical protein WL32_28325 [Burkholderia cepacia]|nr:hypothetical protein WL32_28325 [Burkholderia cepacia]
MRARRLTTVQRVGCMPRAVLVVVDGEVGHRPRGACGLFQCGGDPIRIECQRVYDLGGSRVHRLLSSAAQCSDEFSLCRL